VFVVCCVGSGRCDELVARSEESYRVSVSNFVWSRNVSSEAARSELGISGHGMNKILPGGLLGPPVRGFSLGLLSELLCLVLVRFIVWL